MKEISWVAGAVFLVSLIFPEQTAHEMHKWVTKIEAGWHQPIAD